MIKIPSSGNELSSEWFTTILKLPENEKIKSCTLQRLGEANSVSGFIYRVKLEYSNTPQNAPESVITKIPRPRELRTESLVHFREVRFYQIIASQLNVDVPKLIYADIDKETGDYILVIQDHPDSITKTNEMGASLKQAYKLLDLLAKMHSHHWLNPKLKEYDFLGNMLSSRRGFISILPKCLPVFLSRFSKYIQPDEMQLYEALPECYEKVTEPLLKSPYTLLHNDFSMKNILINNKTEPHLVLVDWANVGWGPCARDLSFFVETSVPPKMRAKYEKRFLKYYLDRLCLGGVSGYSFDQLMDDYRRSIFCDFGRMVRFGGREVFSLMYEEIIRTEILGRTGSVKELDLQRLL